MRLYLILGIIIVYLISDSYAMAGLNVDGVTNFGGNVRITLTADSYNLTIPAAHWYKVYEPDGDRCIPSLTFPYTITDGNTLELIYPTDFVLDDSFANTGDGLCTTTNIGEYEVDVDAKTLLGTINYKVDFDVSFFVLSESPVGMIIIIGSGITALGAFIALKKR